MRGIACFPMALAVSGWLTVASGQDQPFEIEVLDAATGRGVPLVELRTVNQQRFFTDSAGRVAIQDPEWMGRTVYFHVQSHGYEYPADGFGYRGKALQVAPGKRERLSLTRRNVAERLYRVTGAGIYSDSVRLGHSAPIAEPLLNALVTGSDSVLSAVYRGRIVWFWGDTNRPSYPLGNFHTPGATSPLPGSGGLDPSVGVNLAYVINPETGFAAETANMPGSGPTWLSGLTVLREEQGGERLFAGYAKIKPPLETYERGLVRWDDSQRRFVRETVFKDLPPLHPDGHSFQHTDDSGIRHVYFAAPLPLVRVRADAGSLADPTRYEGYTCLEALSRPDEARLDRDPQGRLRYGWKPGTPPLGHELQSQFIKQGKMRDEERLVAFQDPDTGRAVRAHGGSVAWNEYRGCWVAVFVELGGESSLLGDLWLAEAPEPVGPWVYARRILSHDNYSFYNPRHHPFLDQEGGRLIYFEGTYTHTFSGNQDPTPRYDYNQVMYRLDLADPRLNLPAPLGAQPWDAARQSAAFFALPNPAASSIPIYLVESEGMPRLSRAAPPGQPAPAFLFHALPAGIEDPPPTTALLYAWEDDRGAVRYGTEEGPSRPPGRRADAPLCRVWLNPLRTLSE